MAACKMIPKKKKIDVMKLFNMIYFYIKWIYGNTADNKGFFMSWLNFLFLNKTNRISSQP